MLGTDLGSDGHLLIPNEVGNYLLTTHLLNE